MRRRWAAALAVAAFAAGVATGVLGVKFLIRKEVRRDPRERVLALQARLADRLDLDADQRAQWDAVSREAADEMAAALEEGRGRAREVRERYEPRLREILRPDQAKRFDEIRAEWERRRPGRRRGAGPDGP